jgi:hypothetical protein
MPPANSNAEKSKVAELFIWGFLNVVVGSHSRRVPNATAITPFLCLLTNNESINDDAALKPEVSVREAREHAARIKSRFGRCS